MQVRKDKYKGNSILAEGLNLVEEKQIMESSLRRTRKSKKAPGRVLSATPAFVLNNVRADMFKFDPNYLENDETYKAMKAGILGGRVIR
jgi:pre-mRNA-splicing factor CWC22